MKISWLASIGIGVVTAIVGLLVGGWLANRSVTWYQISSREGASGYFVIFQALLAGVVGLVVGIVVSRYVGNFIDVTVLRAFASAQLVMLLLLGAIGGIARLVADVPPEIDGVKLLLSVELSWPESNAPVVDADAWRLHLKLRSTSGGGLTDPHSGPLWTDHISRDGGRVVIPGAVEVYTSRGKRILEVMDGDSVAAAFEIPLGAYPKRAALTWSDWKPVAAASASPTSLPLQVRYRVVKRNEPVRTDTVGPFTIDMMVKAFQFVYYSDNPPLLDADATYTVSFNGQPVVREARLVGRAAEGASSPTVRFNEINSISVVGGSKVALVAELDGRWGPGGIGLIREDNGVPVVEYVSGGRYRVLTHRFLVGPDNQQHDVATFDALDGAFDRTVFATPALYTFPEAVLDTRTLAIHPIMREQYDNDLKNIAPVSLSPDGTKLARLGGDATQPVLRELSLLSGASRDLSTANTPIGNGAWATADRAWFDYYFEWSGTTPNQTIVPRANLLAMPRRGLLKEEPGYRQYDISPVDSGMRDVVEQFLIDKFHATAKPDAPTDYSHTLLVDGMQVHIYFTENKVGVFMDRYTNTDLMVVIAKKFDEALATRQFDSHFLSRRPE